MAGLLVSGCGSSMRQGNPRAVACAAPCTLGVGARAVTVFAEPDAGAAPILSALATATTSLDVEVYQLSDARVIHGLEDAANRGVRVRVILEQTPFGDAAVAAQVTAEELRSAGVEVEGGNPAFRYTHAKFLVVDEATGYILSANLTHAGLGGSSAGADRDYGVVDTDPTDVAEIGAIFAADWARTPAHPAAANLVVSPDNARAKLLALIASARSTLAIEDEELQDGAVVTALAAAAARGVVVQVMLPDPASGGPPASQLNTLAQAHVAIRYSGHLYMHAKLMLLDGVLAFVGSVNFSTTSLDANRELGVLVANPAALDLLVATFTADWRTGTPA
jgi:phosphatidylserine/phosphatidylglycerophosphate/cardiolipin synthase-like enzyme